MSTPYSFAGTYSPQEYCRSLSYLSHCANLRRLDLFLHTVELAEAAEAIVEDFVRLPNPPPISEVTIALAAPAVPAAQLRRRVPALCALNGHLCKLGRLHVVTVSPTTLETHGLAWGKLSIDGRRAGVEVLRANLPKLWRRGILRVV